MKKIFSLLLVVILCLSLFGCNTSEKSDENEMTVDYAIEHLLDSEDLSSLEFLLNTKDTYKKLNGEEIKHSLAFEWIEMKRIYKKSESGLSQFSTYTGDIVLKRDGTGETKSPGNEPLSWLVDGDYLFFKSITDGKEVIPVTPEETKYKYEVREIRTDENVIDTVYACYSVEEGTYNTLFLLVHPQSKFVK